MRYLLHAASIGLILTTSSAVLAQANAIDPFEIVSAELTKTDLSKTTTRLHKTNDGDKTVSIYHSKNGLKVESMGPEKAPDWMEVNLGSANAKATKMRRDKLESTLIEAYGVPNSLRGQIKSWDVPATTTIANHAGTTTVMLYTGKSGDHMLKLDRRRGGVGTPMVSRPVQKTPTVRAKVQSAPEKAYQVTQTPVWDGQPD